MTDEVDSPKERGAFLSIVYTILVGLLIHGVLLVICSGVPVAVIAGLAGFGAVGFLHYLLWGRSLSRELAREQANEEFPGQVDEEKGPDRLEPKDWTPEEKAWYRRF